jgi:outer membrane lipoprotein-sorting protein
MKRIIALIVMAVANSLALAPMAADAITLDGHQKEVVDKVSSYFSRVHTMQGSFLQSDGADRRMKGKFYLSRPGRFRFDYARPSRKIVISDGQTLAVQDLDLNNEDRVPLDQTVFRLLLQSDVNLVRDAKVMEVEESAGLIAIRLRDNDPNVPGELKLILADKPDLKLKAWWTKNGDGIETRIDVSDLVEGVQLDADLFKIGARSWSE